MRVIDEEFLRANKITKGAKFELLSDDILTPMAKDYIEAMKIKVVKAKKTKQNSMPVDDTFIKKGKSIFVDATTGVVYKKKPENMTHLSGNKLVKKDHPRIVFRGKLDSLEAKIMEVQILACKNGLSQLVSDLGEVLDFVRQILGAEVKESAFDCNELFGLGFEEIHKMSHYPKDYLGIGHPMPNYEMGEVAIGLNALRTKVRETELSAISAFNGKREDIVLALNRLSSAIYVLVLKLLAGKYWWI